VLVDIGNGSAVGVETATVGEGLGEQRASSTGEADADARLQNAIAARDQAFLGIIMRAVQWVGKRSDQLFSGGVGQARVGLESDDKSRTRELFTHNIIDKIAGIRGAAKQIVELQQFATLSFPAHPGFFVFVPLASTV